MIVVSGMARELGERLLETLRRVEQLYEGSGAADASSGDSRNAPEPDQDVQALDNHGPSPSAPPSSDPPHGNDPRYWIDVSKIRYIPDGQLAPYNYTQIGPNLWAPDPHPGFDSSPAPPPVKYPLDVSDIRTPDRNGLLPAGYMPIAPGFGVPDPDAYFQPQAPWTPKQPIDIRDIIQVSPGTLAPSGYIEYLPGWWCPEYPSRPTMLPQQEVPR